VIGRPGNNLYTCSVLAVDIRTGKLRWHYQLVHHDVYEADLGIPIVLYETRVGGRRRKALAVMRADGHMFTLDRETGEPLLAVEERPVPQLESQRTSPTQPFPVNGESILMSCDEWRTEKIPAGFVLGCMWTPPASPPPSTDPQNILTPFPAAKGGLLAYSPDTQYFYAHSRSFLYWARRSQDPYFLNWVGAVPGLKAYSRFVAIDSRTGKIAWRKAVPDARTAGPPTGNRRWPGISELRCRRCRSIRRPNGRRCVAIP
jgi:quinohemoprotein ethanol dehydrogenase